MINSAWIATAAELGRGVDIVSIISSTKAAQNFSFGAYLGSKRHSFSTQQSKLQTAPFTLAPTFTPKGFPDICGSPLGSPPNLSAVVAICRSHREIARERGAAIVAAPANMAADGQVSGRRGESPPARRADVRAGLSDREGATLRCKFTGRVFMAAILGKIADEVLCC